MVSFDCHLHFHHYGEANEAYFTRCFFLDEDESALPPSIQDYLDKLRSTEGPESPQYSKPKEPKKHSAKEKCERDYRCIICGFNSSRLDVLLFHTEQKHPTERDVIGRLRLRLLHAAFNPKGYRFDNANEEVEEEEEEEGT
ncbi:hypothetical protein ECG_06216 [Echinococcus granulosus]|nr:hypothetical protein ECG_06216 [Echinococcus granulosus]